jgi:SulP family sulfate permease
LFVLLTLLFLAPVFAYLPTATLAGIVIVAGFGLLDPAEFKALWDYRKIEFWMAAATIFAVLTLGMLVGILVAVGLSLLAVVLRASSPSTAFLGRVPGSDTYRDIADHPDAETFPGLLIYRFDAPLFFANAALLRDDIIAAIEGADTPVVEVLFDAESMYDIDSTGAQILLEVLDELDDLGIGFSMARVRTELRDEFLAARVDERLSGDGIYLEVDDGVAAFLRRADGTPPTD